MTKKILAVVLSTAMVFATFSLLTAQDQTANSILSSVSRTYKSYKSIKAGFQVSIDNQQSTNKISQSGTLYVKGKKFRIDMKGQEIYCDGSKMWTYFKDENEVQISKYDPSEQEINPSEIFTIYEKGFDYKYIGESLESGKKVQKLELIPQDKSKPYFKVKLSVEKASHKITQMTVLNKNGISSTYKITSFSGNVSINDNFFKFDNRSKPGVIEIDLSK
jgi:outer membrane lipoprotein-sorting protein